MPAPTIWRWLSGSTPAGSAVSPSTQRIENGWVANLPIAAEAINWAWQAISDLVTSASRFDRLEDAVELLQAGETGIVIEGDPDDLPFYYNGGIIGGMDGAALLAVSARYFVVFDEVGISHKGSFIAERDEAGYGFTLPTDRVDITLTNSVTNQRAVATDGTTFVFAHDQYVEAFNASGVSQWVYDHGAAVYDVAIHGGQVFLCGELGTGSKQVRSIAVATGTQTWSYQHSAAGSVNAIAATSLAVFIGGSVSSYSSSAAIRALDFATGNDAANEGGTAADDSGVAWDDDNASQAIPARCLAAVGNRLMVASDKDHVAPIQVRVADSGAVIGWDVYDEAHADMEGLHVALDHRFGYVAQSDGVGSGDQYGALSIYDLSSGERVGKAVLYNGSSGYLTHNNQISVVATDGRQLWVNSPCNSAGITLPIPMRPELVRRVDGDEQGLSWALELQYTGER